MTLALATCASVPALAADDRLLLPALGVAAVPVVWSDPAVDWAGYDGVVIRSCWDYHLQPEAFEEWTRRLEGVGVPVWNPPEVLRWNARKTYLRDLAQTGVPTVPTRFVEPDAAPDLGRLLRRVQTDHGGLARLADPPPDLVEGGFQLMELELLEPGLFLSLDSRAPGRFARAIVAARAPAAAQE